jgi:hypothetical protein
MLLPTDNEGATLRRPPFDPTRLSLEPIAESRFTAELARYQDSAQLSDKDFVRSLGVSIFLWRKTRAGRLHLGHKLLIAGGDFVPVRIYQAAEASLNDRVRGRLNGHRERGEAA